MRPRRAGPLRSGGSHGVGACLPLLFCPQHPGSASRAMAALPAAPLPGAPLLPPPHLLTLTDGRRLSYSFLGAPLQHKGASTAQGSSAPGAAERAAAADSADGGSSPDQRPPPILYFHGFSSSRLEAGLLHGDALHYGLSIVAVDRPGAGHSTHNPKQVSPAPPPPCLPCRNPHTAPATPMHAERGEHGKGRGGAARCTGAGASHSDGCLRWQKSRGHRIHLADGRVGMSPVQPARQAPLCCTGTPIIQPAVWPSLLPCPCLQAARRLHAPAPRSCRSACRRSSSSAPSCRRPGWRTSCCQVRWLDIHGPVPWGPAIATVQQPCDSSAGVGPGSWRAAMLLLPFCRAQPHHPAPVPRHPPPPLAPVGDAPGASLHPGRAPLA